MTYQEALQKEKIWHKRCVLIGLFHYQKVRHKKKWTMRHTAKRLNISVGQVSENLKLMKAILKDVTLENLTREQALQIVKNEHLRTR
jgi:hypothetical protein